MGTLGAYLGSIELGTNALVAQQPQQGEFLLLAPSLEVEIARPCNAQR